MPQDAVFEIASNLKDRTGLRVRSVFGSTRASGTDRSPNRWSLRGGTAFGCSGDDALLPAPAGSGIVFRRTDLDNFEIPAIGRNVAKVSYATSLMRQGVLISTTEHLLSALIGMGVDNVIVESTTWSCRFWMAARCLTWRRFCAAVSASSDAGARRCAFFIRWKCAKVKIHRRVSRRGYRISYTIDFPAPIGQQKTCVDLAAETYGARLRRRAPLATRPTRRSCATWA